MSGLVVVGAASSAGAHHAGVERAPRALREAGFVDRLLAGGLPVQDRGDVVAEVFAVDHAEPTRRNLPAVLGVVNRVADVVADVAAGGGIPIVLGGDCTITLGVVAGLQRGRPHVGMLYIDGDADLSTPDTTTSGVLDAMGAAHLLGLADTQLAGLGVEHPMLTDDRLVLFGYDESDPESFPEAVLRDRPALVRFADRQVRADPRGCAEAALAALAAGSAGLVLHFDVDAVDSGDLPLADFPHYGTGVGLEQAGEVIALAAAAPELAAVVLTEVNPGHDPDGEQLRRYVETVAGALATGLGTRSGID